MYRHSHLTLVVALVAALLISAVPAHAQPELTTIQLQLLDEIAGTLDSTTPELHYTLSVHEGEVFSILAWLDVREGLNIHLFDPAGVDVAEAIPVNISGDVYFVIDAIIPPQAGDYEIVVSSETPSDFGLLTMPGYSFPLIFDHFNGADGELGYEWSEIEEPGMFSGIVNEEYLLRLDEPSLTYTIMSADKAGYEDDIFVQADIRVETEADYYFYGFGLRVDGGGSTFRGYYVAFTSHGEWRVWLVQNNETTPLISLQTSPLIDTGNPNNARIGVWMRGSTISLFYNGQFVGQVTDPNATFSMGGVTFLASTVQEPDGLPLSIYYDNLVVNMPIDRALALLNHDDEASSTSDAAGPDIDHILDQSNAGEAGQDTLPFDLEGKPLDLPSSAIRTKGFKFP